MSAITSDQGRHDHLPEQRDWAGPADKSTTTAYGFWIFLTSDIIMFASFFAGYAVLAKETAGGPGASDLFEPAQVAVQTACLLLSTFSCAMAGVAAQRRKACWAQVSLLVTGLLGAAFLALELREFAHLIGEGATPQRSAFLSGFFLLVGCHGLHVACGLLWLGTMMAQLRVRGFKPYIERRLQCFSLYWHALDIVWVGLFSIVYLWGATA